MCGCCGRSGQRSELLPCKLSYIKSLMNSTWTPVVVFTHTHTHILLSVQHADAEWNTSWPLTTTKSSLCVRPHVHLWEDGLVKRWNTCFSSSQTAPSSSLLIFPSFLPIPTSLSLPPLVPRLSLLWIHVSVIQVTHSKIHRNKDKQKEVKLENSLLFRSDNWQVIGRCHGSWLMSGPCREHPSSCDRLPDILRESFTSIRPVCSYSRTTGETLHLSRLPRVTWSPSSKSKWINI